MAHLEALGIEINTSNVLRVRGNVKYYKILGVLVVDLISGANHIRASDFGDVGLDCEDILDAYVGYDTSTDKYEYYSSFSSDTPLIGKFQSASVLDMNTRKISYIGHRYVYYKIFPLLYIEVDLAKGKLHYIHGLDARKLVREKGWEDGDSFPCALGSKYIKKGTALFDFLTDKETGTIIFDTTVCVFDEKDTLVLPKGCKCLDLSNGYKINKLVCDKELEYIAIANKHQLKTVYISKFSNKELIRSLIYGLGRVVASSASFGARLYHKTVGFLGKIKEVDAETAFEYCNEPENKEIVDEILKKIEIVVY
jgi:hypothetical protein